MGVSKGTFDKNMIDDELHWTDWVVSQGVKGARQRRRASLVIVIERILFLFICCLPAIFKPKFLMVF